MGEVMKIAVGDELRPAVLKPASESRRKRLGNLVGAGMLVHGAMQNRHANGKACVPYYVCEFENGCVRFVVAGELVGSPSTTRIRNRVEARGFCKWGEPL